MVSAGSIRECHMPHDAIFQIIIAVISVAIYGIRLAYRKWSVKMNTGTQQQREILLIPAAILWTLSVLLYCIGFEDFTLRVDVPSWFRWIGVGGMMACMPLSVWVYRSLGKHFSPKLRLRDDHRLVTTGPYRFVRHPLYATLFLYVSATAFVSEDLRIIIAGALIAAVILFRIPREEAQLAGRFASSYAEYRKKTGSFIPKLFASSA